MSFRLKNAPMVFMELMNSIFQDYLKSLLIVFIDYILIYSKNEIEHKSHLKLDLHVVKKHQLYEKFSKCEFWLRSISFLGHVISGESKEVDPKKRMRSKIVLDIDSHGQKKLLEFSWYKSFFHGFSSIESPLKALNLKKVMFEWPEAFEKVLKS